MLTKNYSEQISSNHSTNIVSIEEPDIHETRKVRFKSKNESQDQNIQSKERNQFLFEYQEPKSSLESDPQVEEYIKNRDISIIGHREIINSMKQILILILDEHDALIPLEGAKREMLAASLDVFLFEIITKAQDMKNNDSNHLHQVLELKDMLRKQGDLMEYHKSLHKDYEKKIHDLQVQILLKDGLLSRRDNDLDRQRERFYKEISVLKEMLYRREHSTTSSKPRRQDEVELVDWKAELENIEKNEKKKDTKEDSERITFLTNEIQRYKQQVQELNIFHNSEIKILREHLEDKIKLLEDKLLHQAENYDSVTGQVQDSAKEVLRLQNIVQQMETEKKNQQKMIEELEKKILVQQDIECQLQGSVSSKLHEIEKMKQDIQSYQENAGFVIYDGEKISILEAKKIITDAQLGTKSWQKTEKKLQSKINAIQFMNEDIMMKYCHLMYKYSDLEKQYEIKCAQLRDRIKSFEKLTSGDEIAHLKIEMEAKQNSQTINNLNEKVSLLESNLSHTQAKLSESEQRSEKYLQIIQNLESEIAILRNKYRNAKERFSSPTSREKSKTSASEKQKSPSKGIPPSGSFEDEDDDVFIRLQKRYHALDKKRKEQREDLFKERQHQLERVIDSVGNLKNKRETEIEENQNISETNTSLDNDMRNHWTDLKSFISKEMEVRMQQTDSKKTIKNLLSSTNSLSSDTSYWDMVRSSIDEQNTISVQLPLSPRPKTARPLLRKNTDWTENYKNSPESLETSENINSPREGKSQVPIIPYFHASAQASKPKRPSTARIRSAKKSREAHSPTKPARRYSASSIKRKSISQNSSNVEDKGNTTSRKSNIGGYAVDLKTLPSSARESQPKTPRPLSARAHSARRQSQPNIPINQPTTEYILQASRQVRLDHNQRKKIYWEMQFKEEPQIDGSLALTTIPINKDAII